MTKSFATNTFSSACIKASSTASVHVQLLPMIIIFFNRHSQHIKWSVCTKNKIRISLRGNISSFWISRGQLSFYIGRRVYIGYLDNFRHTLSKSSSCLWSLVLPSTPLLQPSSLVSSIQRPWVLESKQVFSHIQDQRFTCYHLQTYMAGVRYSERSFIENRKWRTYGSTAQFEHV